MNKKNIILAIFSLCLLASGITVAQVFPCPSLSSKNIKIDNIAEIQGGYWEIQFSLTTAPFSDARILVTANNKDEASQIANEILKNPIPGKGHAKLTAAGLNCSSDKKNYQAPSSKILLVTVYAPFPGEK